MSCFWARGPVALESKVMFLVIFRLFCLILGRSRESLDGDGMVRWGSLGEEKGDYTSQVGRTEL
jgi:hypothetical protein